MKKKKSILILTADAGFGHRSASNAVSEVLIEKYGSECHCIILNPIYDRPAPFILRNSMRNYDDTVRRSQAFYKLTYLLSDLRGIEAILKGALTGLLYKNMRNLILEVQPDAILSTYHLYNAPLAAALSASRYSVPFFTVITDLASVHQLWFQTRLDKLFVGNDKVRAEAISQGIPKERIILSGVPIHPDFVREKRTKPEIRMDLGWAPDLTTILAVSSRRVEHMVDHLEAINCSGFQLQLAIVSGGDDILYRRIKEIKWRIPVHLYNYVENIPSLMHASDILISKAGGLIIAESLASSLPIIMVDFIPGQETGNIAYILENRAGVLAKTPPELLNTLEDWLKDDKGELKLVSYQAGRIGNPGAAYRIGETIWEAIQ